MPQRGIWTNARLGDLGRLHRDPRYQREQEEKRAVELAAPHILTPERIDERYQRLLKREMSRMHVNNLWKEMDELEPLPYAEDMPSMPRTFEDDYTAEIRMQEDLRHGG